MKTKVYTMEQMVRKLGWNSRSIANVIVGRTETYLNVSFTNSHDKTINEGYTFLYLSKVLKCDEVQLGHVSYYNPILKKEIEKDQVLVAIWNDKTIED